MKIRQLADAAIVAALLLTSIPDLNPEDALTPEALLTPASMTQALDPTDAGEDTASRKLS